MSDKRKCPQCSVELELTDAGNYYCPADDLTFTVERGKHNPQSKGRLKVIEEDLAHTKKKLDELQKNLIGDDDDDW